MKGEYIGKDGRKHKWTRFGNSRVEHESWNAAAVQPHWFSDPMAIEDLENAIVALNDLAKAALDELVEEEEAAEEWVELDDSILRVSLDGARAQLHVWGHEEWEDINPNVPPGTVLAAYRKGLEVRDEAVRELVEAVKSAYGSYEQMGTCGTVLLSPAALQRILDAARRVKL